MSRGSNSFLPYGRHWVEEEDIAAVVEVLRSDFLTTGPAVEAFEAALGEAVEAPAAVACSSGTAALHLAALALDLEPGERVVVPSETFVATANAVRYVGGEVVFADCDPRTGLMGPGHLDEALRRARAAGGAPVRAVFPVHLAGQCAGPAELAEIAGRHGLTVVEDASHAIGTRYGSDGHGIPVGACRHSTMAVFSFHPVKTVAMGEGGAVTCTDARLARRLRQLRSHGIERDPAGFTEASLAFDRDGRANPWHHELTALGFNYRASDIHCALGLSQLARLDRLVARRRALADRYDQRLSQLAPAVQPLARVPGCAPAWHLYVVLIDFPALGLERAQLMRELRVRGIGTQVHYIPVHRQPYYRDRYGELDLPGTQSYFERCLSLPLFPAMADSDVDRVVEALSKVLGDKS